MVTRKKDLSRWASCRKHDGREPVDTALWDARSSGDHSKYRRAFALVELLAVCAVVAILAAVLTSVIGKAMARADGIKCTSNLRHIGVAFGLYQSDNNGHLPGAYYSSNNPDTLNQWWRETSVAAYLVDNGTNVSVRRYFECPSSEGPAIIHYCYNSKYENKPASVVPPGAVIVTENHGQPSGIVYNSSYWWGVVGFRHPTPTKESAAQVSLEDRRARATALHMDGHVEYLTPEALLERSDF